jgi:hypothetical protein
MQKTHWDCERRKKGVRRRSEGRASGGSFDWTFGLELKHPTELVTLNKPLTMKNVPV